MFETTTLLLALSNYSVKLFLVLSEERILGVELFELDVDLLASVLHLLQCSHVTRRRENLVEATLQCFRFTERPKKRGQLVAKNA